jgi:hypothetical protein
LLLDFQRKHAMMNTASMKRLCLSFLLLTTFVWAQDAPSSEQTTTPIGAKPQKKGPLTCDWKAGDPASKEMPIASGEVMRSLECGDYSFSAVIVSSDAFNFGAHADMSLPITYVLFTLRNRGEAPIDLKLQQFEMTNTNGKHLKPISPVQLAERVRRGPANLDYNQGPNIGRDVMAASQVIQQAGGTKEQKENWEKQAQTIKREGLREAKLAEDATTTMNLYFPADKNGITLTWKAPTGDTLIIPAPPAPEPVKKK